MLKIFNLLKKLIGIIFICLINYELSAQNYSVPKEHLLSYKDSINLSYLGLDIKNTKYDHLKLRHLIYLNKKVIE